MRWQFEVYQIGIHSWGWKLRRPDGTLFCMSDEHYPDAEKADKGIRELRVVAHRANFNKIKIVYIDSQGEEMKRGAKKSRKETPKQDKKPQAVKDAEWDEKNAKKKAKDDAKQLKKKPLKTKTKSKVL